MNLNDDVTLKNKSGKKFESKWDGKKFVINKGSGKDVKRGLALHFIEKYPNAKLEIEEIEEEEPTPRKAKKEKEEQGTAFEELG